MSRFACRDRTRPYPSEITRRRDQRPCGTAARRRITVVRGESIGVFAGRHPVCGWYKLFEKRWSPAGANERSRHDLASKCLRQNKIRITHWCSITYREKVGNRMILKNRCKGGVLVIGHACRCGQRSTRNYRPQNYGVVAIPVATPGTMATGCANSTPLLGSIL